MLAVLILGAILAFLYAFTLTWLSYLFAKRFMIHKEVKAEFSAGLFFVNVMVFYISYCTARNAFTTLPALINSCAIQPIIITIICTAIGITAKPPREYKKKTDIHKPGI